MFNSRKNKHSNLQNMTGESLFNFLKRKKKMNQNQSLKNSRQQQLDMSFSDINVKQYEQQQTARDLTSRKHGSSNISPQKVSFIQFSDQQKKSTSRTFINMISPLQNRNSASHQKYDSTNVSKVKASDNQSASKRQKCEYFSRKQLNNSINILKQTINELIGVGRSLKQKSHSLCIQMRPVLKIAEENCEQNRAIKKKVEEARQKLRTMECQFNKLDINNADSIIQGFHKKLAEHLNSVEAQSNARHEKAQMSNYNSIKAQKDKQIQDLQNENKNLMHSFNVLQKKIQKMECMLDQEKQKSQQSHRVYHTSLQQKQKIYESTISQLQQQNATLKQIAQEYEKYKMQSIKKLKDAIYTKQIAEKKLVEANQEAKSARQQFLVSQIMQIKQQFQRDISQLMNLYSSKQQDQLKVIEQQNRQINDLNSLALMDKEKGKKMIYDFQIAKAALNKYKKQNECLVTDMHRMNEELYQHWLALKDIKTLAQRLQIFPKLSRIYQDLAYNDMLFS